MGKGKIIGVIIAVVVACGFAAGGYYYNAHNLAEKAKAEVQMQINQNKEALANAQTHTSNITTSTQDVKSQENQNNKDSQKVEVKEETVDNPKIESKNDKPTVSKPVETKPTTENDKQKEDTTTTNQKPAINKPTTENNTETPKLPVGATITSIVPNGNIIYSAEKYAVPANEVQEMVQGKYPGNQKEVFLTFDDGPSASNTPKILKILQQEGVHGTFFVLGSELKSQADKNVLKDEILEGNAIANHSYSHSYKILYPNNSVDVSKFMQEFNETNNIMKSVLGKNFNARVVRMPGGYMSRAYYHDKNLPALNAAFKKAGITSIDWTAESGDAEGKNYSSSQLVQNAINESKGWSHVVLLMHDIKPKTTESLPQIIQYYKDHGYQFKVISNTGIN